MISAACKFPVEFPYHTRSNGGCFFHRLKIFFPHTLSSNIDICAPRLLFTIAGRKGHTNKSACVVRAKRPVARTLRVVGFSQIGKYIVGSGAIFVVDLSLWPRSCHVKPRETVGAIIDAINHYLDVPLSIWAVADVSSHHLSLGNDPCKQTCLWVVVENLAQALSRDMAFFSHRRSFASRVNRATSALREALVACKHIPKVEAHQLARFAI